MNHSFFIFSSSSIGLNDCIPPTGSWQYCWIGLCTWVGTYNHCCLLSYSSTFKVWCHLSTFSFFTHKSCQFQCIPREWHFNSWLAAKMYCHLSSSTAHTIIYQFPVYSSPSQRKQCVMTHHRLCMEPLFFMTYSWYHCDVIISSLLSQLHFAPLWCHPTPLVLLVYIQLGKFPSLVLLKYTWVLAKAFEPLSSSWKYPFTRHLFITSSLRHYKSSLVLCQTWYLLSLNRVFVSLSGRENPQSL